MPTDAEQLATIKTNTLALLADLSAHPKPSYMIDGQSVQWGAYHRMLMDQLKEVNAQIAAETPFEIHSRGFT